jgi:hypothetical protein
MPIASVTFAGLGLVLGLLALVGRQGTTDVDAFLELPLLVAANITLVGPGIDGLTLRYDFFLLVAVLEERTAGRKRCSESKAYSRLAMVAPDAA